MPPRSNDFQRLIALIESQLVPAGASVEQSVMLPDNISGQLREVDVVLRMPIGKRVLMIGIECRDHARRADLPWLEQTHSKFESLPLDRCVAVSRSGFSKAAKARAELWNIETMTLSSAQARDWLDIAACEFVGQRFEIQRLSFTIDSPYGTKADLQNARLNAKLRLPDGRQLGLVSFIKRLINRHEAFDAIGVPDPSMVQNSIGVCVELPPGFVFTDQLGREWSLVEIDAQVTRHVTRLSAQLSYARYGEAAVAFGTGTLRDVPYTLALTQSDRRRVKAHVAFDGPGHGIVINLTSALSRKPRTSALERSADGTVVKMAVPLAEL